MLDPSPIACAALTKRFGKTLALDGVDWRVPAGSVVGLVGRNGSGKTTLLRAVLGLTAPTSGGCTTLGRPSVALDEGSLARIGFVDQGVGLLDWLRVGQHIDYMAALQPRWDRALERRLTSAFELDRDARVGALSAGVRQRLAVLLALAHRPALVLLDEPVSAQDPVARIALLDLLLERAVEDGATLVVSSHVLHDIEKIIDRVLCLERGRVVTDEELDTLKESYAEWIVTPASGELPTRFDEPYVLRHDGDGRLARLAVRASEGELAQFAARHGARVERRALELERIFPLLGATSAQEVSR